MVWFEERMERTPWLAFEARINARPPEAEVRPIDVEQEGQQFMAFLGAVTGGEGVAR